MGAAVDRLDGGGMTEDHTPDTTAEFDDVESENLPDSAAMPDQDDTDLKEWKPQKIAEIK